MRNEYYIIDKKTIGIILNSKKYGNKLCKIDVDDFPRVKCFSWSLLESHGNFYAISSTSLIVIKMHRLIMSFPENQLIDHINNCGLDNKKENLRICSNQENRMNLKKSSSSTNFKGVVKHKKNNSYVAQIGFNNKKIYLGSFKTPIEAAQAYNKKATELFGMFAKLNTI